MLIETVFSFLVNTPKYVYAIFFYLLYGGLKATKERTVSIYKSMLLTMAFAGISLDLLIKILSINMDVLAVWIFSLGMGIWFGWLQVKRIDIKVDKLKKLLLLPGTWTTLCIVLCVFSLKYYIGYQRFNDPHIMEDIFFQISALSISGISTGIMVGRLLNYFNRLRNAEHTDLVSS